MIQTLQQLFHYILHIDAYLFAFVSTYGFWTYAALFLVIFCETGLVVTPFLPGDSLLFAAGSIAAHPEQVLHFNLLFVVLVIASILGNKINYLIGRMVGPKLACLSPRLLNRRHLEDTHAFYERHGGKTIILARFLPIIRTFAPFVAGMSDMGIRQFTYYNLISAVLWIGSLLGAGYFLGSFEFIQQNFSLVIYGIIGISILPALAAFTYKKIFPKTIAKESSKLQ